MTTKLTINPYAPPIIRAVLFDLDGTLTIPWFDFDLIRSELGIEGGPILEAIDQMEPGRQEQARAILHRWETEGAEQSELNHGAIDLLNWLHATGRKTGLVTRNRRQNALLVCNKFQMEFDCIVSREDGPVKPDPYPVTEACRLLGVPAQNCLMVGDFIYDMLSGRAAGARTVLITTSDKHLNYHSEADFVIDRFEELPPIIDRLETAGDSHS